MQELPWNVSLVQTEQTGETPVTSLNQHRLTRRAFTRAAGLAPALLVGAACAPSAAPSPTPGSGSAPGAGPPQRAAWEDEWDRLVAAAKQEGKVVITTFAGAGYRGALDEFEKTFPGISVEHQVVTSASVFIPKITEERKANIFSFDAGSNPPPSFLSSLKPAGVFDPVRPVLIRRPDVVDDRNWRFGFEYGFVDNEKQFTYVAEAGLVAHVWINTELVRDGEVRNLRDLLDQKWKGKILMSDVRTGNTYTLLATARKRAGDDAVRRLLKDQEPSFRRTSIDVAQEMVRGTFPIGIGPQRSEINPLQQQGVGRSLKEIDLPEFLAIGTTEAKWLYNRAPHPNAARLFINWSLTKAGQQVWTRASQTNSLRTDVDPVSPSDVADPKATLFDISLESNAPYLVESRRWLEDLLK